MLSRLKTAAWLNFPKSLFYYNSTLVRWGLMRKSMVLMKEKHSSGEEKDMIMSMVFWRLQLWEWQSRNALQSLRQKCWHANLIGTYPNKFNTSNPHKYEARLPIWPIKQWLFTSSTTKMTTFKPYDSREVFLAALDSLQVIQLDEIDDICGICGGVQDETAPSDKQCDSVPRHIRMPCCAKVFGRECLLLALTEEKTICPWCRRSVYEPSN